MLTVRPCDFSDNDYKILHDICYSCSSGVLKKTYVYIRRCVYMHPNKTVCDIFNGTDAFFLGVYGKSHLRGVGIAVKDTAKGCGLATSIVAYEIAKARAAGLRRMTLSTPINESAVEFWKKVGARIIGKGKDEWQMEMLF